MASAGEYSRSRSKCCLTSTYALPCFAIACSSSDDFHAHRARRSRDDLRGGIDIVGVEVLHLLLGDRAQLVLRDRTDFGAVGLGGALLQRQRLADEDGSRREIGRAHV